MEGEHWHIASEVCFYKLDLPAPEGMPHRSKAGELIDLGGLAI